jgi:hypothetical protein
MASDIFVRILDGSSKSQIIKIIIWRGTMPINMEGHRAYKFKDYGGHPAPDGAGPTQPYKCGQNVKVKT